MHILHPVTSRVGTNSFLSFFTTCIPDFFGTMWTGLTHSLSGIEYMIPRDSSFRTSLSTSSLMFGFSFLCGSRRAFAPSSSLMWCMQRSGLIPTRSESVHPMAFLFLLITSSSALSWSSVKRLLIITGQVSPSSRYAYFKFSGKVFNSFFGVMASWGKGFSALLLGAISSRFAPSSGLFSWTDLADWNDSGWWQNAMIASLIWSSVKSCVKKVSHHPVTSFSTVWLSSELSNCSCISSVSRYSWTRGLITSTTCKFSTSSGFFIASSMLKVYFSPW